MNTKVGQTAEDVELVDDNGPLAGLPPVSTEGIGGLPAIPTGMSGMSGDFSQKDFVIPSLKIVGKTGVLSDEFTPGHVLLNKEVVISDGKEPLLLIPLSIRKVWVEDLDFDSEIMPRRFETLADAQAEGYTDAYGEDKRVVEQATIVFLVPVPEDYANVEAPLHLHEAIKEQTKRVFNGEPQFGYTRAMFICQGSAYNAVAKPLITAGFSGHLRGGLHHGTFAFTSVIKTFKTNSWWAPKFVSAGKNTPEMIKWLDEEVIL